MKSFLRKANKRLMVRPQWLIAGAFVVAIIAGAMLLSLPVASANGRWTGPLTALFTATSACCVNGLMVVDAGTHYSLFGQGVILALIQLGGLGIMTFSTFLLVLTGRRLSVQSEFVLMNSFGIEDVRGLPSLLHRAIFFTFVIEGAGALILYWRYLERGMSAASAAYYGIFHAVSAFCNTGISLHSDSLMSFQDDPIFLLCIALLVIFGGLGFLVLYNLSTFKFWHRNRRTRGRIFLHTRIMVTTTIILLLAGTLLFLATERHAALATMPPLRKITATLCMSAYSRTAGFNVTPMGDLSMSGRFLTIPLMFIGGAPGSTAGGTKITTIVVLLFTIVAMLRGRRETEISGRTIPVAIVREATVIFTLGIFSVALFFGLLMLTEQPVVSADRAVCLLFEVSSGFSATGLSLDTTPTLSPASRIVMVLCMYIGRLGPLTAALTIGARDIGQHIRFPEEEIVVG